MQRNLKKRRRKMSIDELIGGADAWFDPSEAKSTPLEEGSYSAQVTDLVIKKDKEVQGKFLADIYEPVFEIKGREVKHKGLFRFKKPDPSTHPNLEENSGSNKSYKELVESFSVKIEEDSEGRFYLPSVDDSDVAGMPVLIDVYHSKWIDNEGNERTTPRAGAIYVWDGQKKKEEDLPF